MTPRAEPTNSRTYDRFENDPFEPKRVFNGLVTGPFWENGSVFSRRAVTPMPARGAVSHRMFCSSQKISSRSILSTFLFPRTACTRPLSACSTTANAVAEDSHPVAAFKLPLLPSTGVPCTASLHEQVESFGINTGFRPEQRHGSGLAENGDVTAVRCQARKPWFGASHAEGHHRKWNDKVLRVRELSTPPFLMLDDRAPEADLTVDAVLRVANPPQLVETF